MRSVYKKIRKSTLTMRLAAGFLLVVGFLVAAAPHLRRAIHFHNTENAFANPDPRQAYLASKNLWRLYPDDIQAVRQYLSASRRAGVLPAAHERSQILASFSNEKSIIQAIALAEFQGGLLAAAASRFEDEPEAASDIDGLRLQMMIAAARLDHATAESAADRLVSEQSANQDDRFTAAVLLSESADSTRRSIAIGEFKRLAHDGHFPAMIKLVMDPAHPTEQSWALGQIAEFNTPNLKEAFERLDVLAAARHPHFEQAIEETKSILAGSQAVAHLTGWFNANGRAAEAITWVTTTQPEGIQKSDPVQFALAESYLYAGDQAGLYGHLIADSWGPNEAIRLALISLCLTEESHQQEFWKRAVEKAENSDSTQRLASVLAQWGVQHPSIES